MSKKEVIINILILLGIVAFLLAVGLVGAYDQDEYIEVNSQKISRLTDSVTKGK